MLRTNKKLATDKLTIRWLYNGNQTPCWSTMMHLSSPLPLYIKLLPFLIGPLMIRLTSPAELLFMSGRWCLVMVQWSGSAIHGDWLHIFAPGFFYPKKIPQLPRLHQSIISILLNMYTYTYIYDIQLYHIHKLKKYNIYIYIYINNT